MEQVVENDQRAALPDADRVGAFEQLSLLGLSAAQIARRTRTPARAVRTALEVTGSAVAAGAMRRHDLTPQQAAVIADRSQGVQLATMQELARRWAADYDWRRVEARLQVLPQFVTEIDGVDIHFIHVRSDHEGALPLVVTHGWPGSVIEQLKIIDPLVDSTAYGAGAEDAFDLVIPSLPGHGFSGKPTTTGWGPIRIARAWVVLMDRLGYTRFGAQGGDWGTRSPNRWRC